MDLLNTLLILSYLKIMPYIFKRKKKGKIKVSQSFFF